MFDILATMTPAEYETVRAELQAQGLWGTAGYRAERKAAQAAETILARIRR